MGVIVTPENIGDRCVASQAAGHGKEAFWFSDWFVQQGFFKAPKVEYKTEQLKDGRTSVRGVWGDGRLRVWVLTGYQHPFDKSWLGVWPD